MECRHYFRPLSIVLILDLFTMCDETDLDALSGCMETFIEAFQEQLLPISPQLIARLVRLSHPVKMHRTLTTVQ